MRALESRAAFSSASGKAEKRIRYYIVFILLGDMLKKTEADFNMSVPQKLLEQLAVNQASSLFSVNAEDEAAGRASIDDINETLRLMVDSTIKSMAREKGFPLKAIMEEE